MRQLNGSDAFFLYSDKPGRHQHISTIYLYDPATAPDGKVEYQQILEHVRDRVSTSRIFRQRLVDVPMGIDYPYWIHDRHFDLEFHMRHIALPQPGDWRQFCILASRLHARPLDLRRPVWEMYVIDGLDNVSWLSPGSFAILVKVHQVAIDDVTEDDFTMALHDREPVREPEEVQRRWFSEQEPSALQLLSLAWFNNTTKLVETGQALLANLPGVGEKPFEADDILHFDDHDAPETRFDHRISPHRVLAPFTFDIAALKTINAAVADATVNDVVLAVVSGALRRYLAHKHELPDHSLYALVPLHAHRDSDAGIPGHRVQLVRVRLMTNVADPIERLASIREEFAEANAVQPVSAEEMSEIQDILPSTAMTLAAKTIGANIGPGKRYRKNHNTIVSIHPGPAETLYLCGAKLVGYTAMAALMDDLGLNHTATSYDGKLTIAPVCDRRMMPDPEFYYDCLRASFTDLRDTAKAAVQEAQGRLRVVSG